MQEPQPDQATVPASAPADNPPRQPDGPWDRRVQFRTAGTDSTFAYRPNQLIVARDALDAVAARLGVDVERLRPEPIVCGDEPNAGDLFLVHGVPDPIALAAELRSRNLLVRPNHVLFAHPLARTSG